METITLRLDGRQVEAQPDQTILEVAKANGVYIPTLCDDPILKPVGVCRVCLVEDETRGTLLASCVAPAAPDMKVSTSSERVLAARRSVVELLMASHPDWCPVCDSANRCSLRQIAAEMGVGQTKLERLHHSYGMEDANAFIQRDLTKCVLCGKCVRACREVHGVGAIDYAYRGFDSRPATLLDCPLEESSCNFCGLCMNLCPVAALAPRSGKARSFKADSRSRSVCPWCACGCSIFVETRSGRLLGVTPDYEGTTPGTGLCIKGQFGYEFVSSPERLTKPLIRRDGVLEEASWDEALDTVAGRLREIKEAHGAGSIGALGAPKCTNEENYALQKLCRAVLGTNNIDNSGSACLAPALGALEGAMDLHRAAGSFADLPQAGCILVVGCDPTASHPMLGQKVKQAAADGSKLIVVDPRRTELAARADVWLSVAPGTDVLLLNSLTHVILADGAYDDEYLSANKADLSVLQEFVGDYAPKVVERSTGIEAEIIRRVAEEVAARGPLSLVASSGVTQGHSGPATVRALANLAILTGSVGRPGGGVMLLGGQNNVHGACEMGALPDRLPGFAPLGDAGARYRIGKAWKTEIPDRAGLSALQMMRAAAHGELKALLVFGENPAGSLPSAGILKTLEGLNLLVVADLFMTQTAEVADVVLPAASLAEKNGTVTCADGGMRSVVRALEPPGEARADFDIVGDLAARLGGSIGAETPAQLRDEIASVISRDGGAAGDGALRFQVAEPAVLPVPAADFPLLLVTGRELTRFGTGEMEARCGMLTAGCEGSSAGGGSSVGNGLSAAAGNGGPPAPRGNGNGERKVEVELGAKDASRLGLWAGAAARVTSPGGAVTATVRVSDSLPEGLAFMATSGVLAEANKLLAGAEDAPAAETIEKTIPVKIEPEGK